MTVNIPSQDRRISAPLPDRLFRMEGSLTELVTIGLTDEGLQMHNSFEGRILSGQPAGGLVRGIDEFLIRPDGTGVVDAREVITADAGSLTATVLGFAHPPDGLQMPPLQVLLDPGFQWPDVDFSIECCAIYRPGSPAFAALGRTAVVHLGHVNMATRELVIEGYPATALARLPSATEARLAH